MTMCATLLIVTAFLSAVDSASGSDPAPFEQEHKFGFKDSSGAVVVEPRFDVVGRFSSGLAPVNLGAMTERYVNFVRKVGGKWGYVDLRGKLVVPVELESAHDFSEGLAQVGDQRGTRFIDPDGKAVIDLGSVSSTGDFHEGKAAVYEDRSALGRDWRTKFIDKKGRKLFEVDGYAEHFSEGLAELIVEREKTDSSRKFHGYIDADGKVVVPARFLNARSFREGLAAVVPEKTVRSGEGWGYIDKSGKFVIQPQFNEAYSFVEGVARVHSGGKLVLCTDGISTYDGGEWREIDRTGKVLKRDKRQLYMGPR
jgi:hypothetical protein